jgi:hypothetical protein
MTTIAATSRAGRVVNPSVRASGEKGSAAPIATTASVETNSGVLGRLRKNGVRRVRIAKDGEALRGERLDEPPGAEQRQDLCRATDRISA